MLTARALQGAASIKAQNVGFQLRLRLRRGRLISARHRLAAFFYNEERPCGRGEELALLVE